LKLSGDMLPLNTTDGFKQYVVPDHNR